MPCETTCFARWTSHTIGTRLWKNGIRRVTESLATARPVLGYLDADGEDTQKPFQVRSTWPSSADQFLMILERLVFAYGYDEEISNTLQNRKGVEDLLATEKIRPGSNFRQVVSRLWRGSPGNKQVDMAQ